MIAAKTIEAIDKAIEKDQGSAYRQALQRIIPKMEDAYRGDDGGHRSHLGASLIGRECSFELWLMYRWSIKKSFPGRILRLFNRGHLEEARFLAMLEAAGFKVWYETETGGQFKFSGVDGHFGSALDGVIQGLPDLPEGALALGEFKTHNEKSFAKLAGSKPKFGDKRTGGDGLVNAKYEHYMQMQECMAAYDLPYGFYLAVNKDTDELYGEIIQLDMTVVQRGLDKAKAIVYADEALPRISKTPGWWKCKFCDMSKICHSNAVPEVNCRTCANVTCVPKSEEVPDGWTCRLERSEVSETPQEGCPKHVFNPHLMPNVELVDWNEEKNYTVLKLPNGNQIKQGATHVKSKDLFITGLNIGT